jgi:hypothetical protein
MIVACDGIGPSPRRRDVESLIDLPLVRKNIILAEMASWSVILQHAPMKRAILQKMSNPAGGPYARL